MVNVTFVEDHFKLVVLEKTANFYMIGYNECDNTTHNIQQQIDIYVMQNYCGVSDLKTDSRSVYPSPSKTAKNIGSSG
jgi:hypothetical protein